MIRKINDIFYSDKNWEEKYDMIFHFAPAIREKMQFDYYDPDTSYEEDVTAYVNALNEAWEKYKEES